MFDLLQRLNISKMTKSKNQNEKGQVQPTNQKGGILSVSVKLMKLKG